MEPRVDDRVDVPAGTPPQPEKMVAVHLELSQAEAEQLRAAGGSAWVRDQLAAAAGRPAAPRAPSATDYLIGLGRARFPLPVSGSAAVRLVDALRKQGMVEAAVTYDDSGGDGDRAIVVDITSLGRAEIERRRHITLSD